MLNSLSSSLKETMRKLAGKNIVDEKTIKNICKDIQRALLQSDADVELIFDLTESIKKRALDEKPPKGLTHKEHVINIFYEELVKFLGSEEPRIPTAGGKILLMGTFGSGKTTTAGKLARFYSQRGLKPCLVACDTYRPAAYEQLQQIGDEVGVPVYGDPDANDSAKVLKKALQEIEKADVIIVDSSGRDALNKDMIDEISELNSILRPDEKYLIIPADMGQQAGKQANAFQERLDITGVIVTKMDSTAKGGGALSACAASGAKIKFIGTGEKMQDLEKYDPKRFVSRLIGYGDLKGLLQKVDKSKAEAQAKKLMKGDFTLDDFYEQIEQVESMGSLGNIMDKLPGSLGNKMPDDFMNMQEEKMQKFKYIIDSMTVEERKEPKKINASCKERIAKGSGTTKQEVSELIKMYRQSKKAMKMFDGKGRGGMQKMQNMLKKLGM